MKEGGGSYSPEDRKRDNLRLVLASVVHCEAAAAPRFVTLRFNEVAERHGLEPVTQDAVERMLDELTAAGYLTKKRGRSLLNPHHMQDYYQRTDKELPDDPGTPPRPPSAPAAVKSRPPADDSDDVLRQLRRG